MATVHGKSSAVLVDAYDLSAYFNSASVSESVDAAETTCFGSSAKTYIPGLLDGTISVEGLFDGAANAVDSILRAALSSSTDKVVTFAPSGVATVGNPAKLAASVETSYEVSTSVGDLVTTSAEFQADAGVWTGVILADLAARGASGNTTGVDGAASSARGYVANLHVTAASGTTPSLTVKVQHSADNSTWADLATFTAATAVTAEQKVSTSATVNRYTRVLYTISGTGPSFTFTVAFSRR